LLFQLLLLMLVSNWFVFIWLFRLFKFKQDLQLLQILQMLEILQINFKLIKLYFSNILQIKLKFFVKLASCLSNFYFTPLFC